MLRNFDLRRGRWLVAALLSICGGAAQAQEKPQYLSQGWSSADRNFFYTTSQGSQLMPYDWFFVLERPGSSDLFRADGLARFGYLPNADETNNPDGLPVGFVKDIGDGAPPTQTVCSTRRARSTASGQPRPTCTMARCRASISCCCPRRTV